MVESSYRCSSWFSAAGPIEGRRLGKLVRGDCATDPEALSDSSEEDEADHGTAEEQ